MMNNQIEAFTGEKARNNTGKKLSYINFEFIGALFKLRNTVYYHCYQQLPVTPRQYDVWQHC
jgi:hypothetical protein